MKFTSAPLEGVRVIEPVVHGDARGFFLETYQKRLFAENGIADDFVQDNHSLSAKGVLRGMHFQAAPMAQAKLIRTVHGSIWDVVLDIRETSATFGRWFAETLSASNRKIMYVPEGFAHGYCALEPDTEVFYKTSRIYSPEHERGIRWDDPSLALPWPKAAAPYTLSEKDRNYPAFAELFRGKAVR
jgi:dTDP-4-dehydrorhamnose 3,5-epimerase